jgi:hypothetical protein
MPAIDPSDGSSSQLKIAGAQDVAARERFHKMRRVNRSE